MAQVLQEKYLITSGEADALASFLTPQLDVHPDKRATAEDMLKHDWLDGIIVAGEEDALAYELAHANDPVHPVPPASGPINNAHDGAHDHLSSSAERAEAVASDPSAADALKPLSPDTDPRPAAKRKTKQVDGKPPLSPIGKSSPAQPQPTNVVAETSPSASGSGSKSKSKSTSGSRGSADPDSRPPPVNVNGT